MSIKATVNPTDETAEITKEEQIADARENETTLLDGLLTAAGFKTSEECIKKRGNFPRRKGPVQLPHSPVE